MMTINRGGSRISIVKTTAHHVPPITIGHLDEKGKDLLDDMLKGSRTVDEIVEYFKDYVNEERSLFVAKPIRSRQPSEEPAEMTDLRDKNYKLKSVRTQTKNIEKQAHFGNNLSATAIDSMNSTMNQDYCNKDKTKDYKNQN